MQPRNEYEALLAEFPTVSSSCNNEQPVKHSVTHHITTSGSQVTACTRRLPQERLAIAQREFDHMLQLSIVRLSSSSWASPLHMVPKLVTGALVVTMEH